MISCAKRLTFSAGHRLQHHEGLCRFLHGHNYTVEVELSRKARTPVDAVGRVVDFAEIKARLGLWLRENWDHAMVLERGDPALGSLEAMGERIAVMPYAPTAENMARFLLKQCDVLFRDLPVRVDRVTVGETETSSATAVRAGRWKERG